VENNKVIKRSITTGLASSTGETEITKGLIGGEDLILTPPTTLKDGDKVKIEGSQ
jgi:hypothetical protein